MTDATTDRPNQPSPAHLAMSPRWQRCRDLVGGTDAVRAKGTVYLPSHPQELPADYDRRLSVSVLYNGLARTIKAMAGLIGQRDPVLGNDVPAVIQQHWENIDNRGTHGAVFLTRLLSDAITTGHCGVLVEYPHVENPEQLSKADETSLGLRPYWIHVRAEDIYVALGEIINGKLVLVLLIVRECYQQRQGQYGVQEVTDYRVYRRDGPSAIAFELWRERREGEETKVVPISNGSLAKVQEIPFVFFAAGDVTGPYATKPPLLDLADVNIAHYQVSSDRRHVMHIACIPVPVREGYVAPAQAEGAVQPVGPNIMQDLPIGGDFRWASPDAVAFEPTKDELTSLERQMASLGLAFLQSETRAAETAEGKRIDATAQNATLSSAARNLQDAAETALGFHAQYLGLTGGSIEVNREFERILLDPQMITALSTLEQAGQLSLETLLRILKIGHVLTDDIDVAAEVARIMGGRTLTSEAADPNAAAA